MRRFRQNHDHLRSIHRDMKVIHRPVRFVHNQEGWPLRRGVCGGESSKFVADAETGEDGLPQREFRDQRADMI